MAQVFESADVAGIRVSDPASGRGMATCSLSNVHGHTLEVKQAILTSGADDVLNHGPVVSVCQGEIRGLGAVGLDSSNAWFFVTEDPSFRPLAQCS